MTEVRCCVAETCVQDASPVASRPPVCLEPGVVLDFFVKQLQILVMEEVEAPNGGLQLRVQAFPVEY